MTLRARLSVAFFVLLLGPLVVGVSALVGAVSTAKSEPVARASEAVRAVVAVHCRRLEAVARTLAVTAAARSQSWAVTPADATGPWAVCGIEPDNQGTVPSTSADPSSGVAAGSVQEAGPPDAGPAVPAAPGSSSVAPDSAILGDSIAGAAYTALAARAEIRDAKGNVAGYAYAVAPVDTAFLAELSAAAGAWVVPIVGGPAGTVPLDTFPDQPLPLALAPVSPNPVNPMPIYLSTAMAAVLVAALLGWWLGNLATRPLRALLGTVDQAASGDLTVRSVVTGRDETGQLAAGLDGLIADMQETRLASITDALTGLGNVRQLNESLRLEIERASRFGRALGVLMIDLDHFKAVNDRYGHRAGDAVLVELSRRIRRAVREVDLAFRRGGEEFVILLPETDVPGSLTAARRIGEAVRDVRFLVSTCPVVDGRGAVEGEAGDAWVPVTVSIGVAVYPRHATTGVELLDAADQALYAAKAAGRDTFVLAGPPVQQRRVPVSVRTVIESGGASGGTTSVRSTAAG